MPSKTLAYLSISYEATFSMPGVSTSGAVEVAEESET